MNPPDPDEIEVSIFGPGFGEALAVHMGHGEWLTVDSCRNLAAKPEAGDNALLEYFDHIGVDPSQAVKLIVVTHWHDDHIEGISDILRAAPPAHVAVTAALGSKDFRAAISPWLTGPGAEKKGLKELERFGRAIQSRAIFPKIACIDKVLFERNAIVRKEVRALSPSDASVLACIADLVQIPREDVSGRMPAVHGNHTSVVLSVVVGDRKILLGADLEVRSSRQHGWLATVDSHTQAERSRYSVFKSSHHGSPNGDHPEIWDKMLVDRPNVILAPFVNGSVMRPQDSDIGRILSRTDKAWITATPKGAKYKPSNRAVIREMEEKARRVQEVPRGYGHVRLRGKLQDDPCQWEVATFGQAMELRNAV